MTPLGKVVLELSDLRLSDLNSTFFFNLIVSFGLFVFGIILLLKSLEQVTESRTRRWTR